MKKQKRTAHIDDGMNIEYRDVTITILPIPIPNGIGRYWYW
jgi:hypothetical protein